MYCGLKLQTFHSFSNYLVVFIRFLISRLNMSRKPINKVLLLKLFHEYRSEIEFNFHSNKTLIWKHLSDLTDQKYLSNYIYTILKLDRLKVFPVST